jgi:CheY-like chemotaxis protein
MSKEIRILLVEDNLINQKVIAHMIGGISSAALESVESGEEAVKRLRNSPFDLVIMDMQLEGMSGAEATEEIRSLRETATSPDVPVVILSGYADSQKEAEAKEAGANRYLLKPLALEDLAELIEAARSSAI